MAIDKNILFTPLRVGNVTLGHRVVMAPLTRVRASPKEHVPRPIMREYYTQRSSVPGTLIITEATFIAEEAGGINSVPGIWSDAQIEAWKKIVKNVHKNGSFIYLQLWALGRAADAALLAENGHPYLSASNVPLSGRKGELKEMTKEQIKHFVGLYAQAAENAVLKAGFDGVEIHGANGYLIDQFQQDVSNKRTDEYGGSVENRARFGLEVVKAVVDRVGAERTAIRLSPWSTFQEMKMQDPRPQFSYFVTELASRYPRLSYLHVVESRVAGSMDAEEINTKESLDFLRDVWRSTGGPFFTAGGFNRENALEHYKNPAYSNEAIVFGRYFISNPDLPKRLEKNIPLIKYDRSTFYINGSEDPKGYTDYPFAEEI